MNQHQLDQLRQELSIKAKNGLDFILAGILVWSLITFIWILDYSPHNKSVLTFMVGALLLPIALVLSKVLKTSWKIKENPLQPLGLWFNFAQLFYFPFLVFVLLKSPEYFLMTYVIITGAHFFPYGWYYKELGYSIMAGVIPIGALLITFHSANFQAFVTGLFMVVCLAILAIWLAFSLKNKKQS